MNQLHETILLSEIIHITKTYMENRQMTLEPDLRKLYSKIKPLFIKSCLKNMSLEITVEKITPFSHLIPSKISYIYPQEALYFLKYISDHLPHLASQKIHIVVHDHQNSESLMHRDFIHLITNISTLGENLIMDILKIDTKYPIDKHCIKGVQKSVTGTLFEKQSSKYFKGKYNPTPESPIPIEALVTKNKNYLRAEEDEYIVLKCPTCANRLKFTYSDIDKYLEITKNCIKLKCSHPHTTHLYNSPNYSFTLDQNIIDRRYTKKAVLMYIINNKGYYGLS